MERGSTSAESQHDIARCAESGPNETRARATKFEEESVMKNTNSNLSKAIRCAVVAVLGMGIVAAPAVNAKPKPKVVKGEDGSKLLLVSPVDLPELARQNGEAMLLHETGDGRTFLYVEQNHGARLAIFDVSDPSDIKQQGMVQLDAQ